MLSAGLRLMSMELGTAVLTAHQGLISWEGPRKKVVEVYESRKALINYECDGTPEERNTSLREVLQSHS